MGSSRAFYLPGPGGAHSQRVEAHARVPAPGGEWGTDAAGHRGAPWSNAPGGARAKLGLLLARWAQSAEGRGQVVLLVARRALANRAWSRCCTSDLGREPAMWLTFRCSPYHTNSALYPVIAHLQRALQFQRDEPAEARLDRLESALQAAPAPGGGGAAHGCPAQRAAGGTYHRWSGVPKHKQKTQEALVAWLVAEAERQPVLAVWEDLQGRSLDPGAAGPGPGPDAHRLLCTLLTCRPSSPRRGPSAPI